MSDSQEQQLLSAFRAVFSEHSDASLRTATPDSIETWDSSNHFVLIELVQESFGIRIPEREAGELLSFDEFVSYLERRDSA